MVTDRMDYRDGFDPITRRNFLLSLLVTITSACAGPTFSSSAKRKGALLDDGGDLYRRASVDLHSHPGPFAGFLISPGASRELSDALAHMKQGKLDTAVFSFPPDRLVLRRDPKTGFPRQFRKPEPDELFRVAQSHFDNTLNQMEGTIARSAAEVIAFKRRGVPCAILAHEGADALEGNLSRVQLFYDRGIRVMQLVHYRINEVGDIQSEPPRHGGLTPFGGDVVKELNRLGIVIDIAHAHSEVLRGVLAESRHPVIDSHTRPAARVRDPRARFRPDDELRAIAIKGGIVGAWPSIRKGETFDDFMKDIDYVKSVVGIDHVGIGTDVNGLGDNTVIPSHREFALIPAALLSRGYSEVEVDKITGGNFMRIFREVAENKGNNGRRGSKLGEKEDKARITAVDLAVGLAQGSGQPGMRP
jgi:membrane dipeptidase